jgi:hypothetical protein
MLPGNGSKDHPSVTVEMTMSCVNGDEHNEKFDLVPATSNSYRNSGPSATSGHFQFECGYLKYSHVNQKWILRHNSPRIQILPQSSSFETQGTDASLENNSSQGLYQWTASIRLEEKASSLNRDNQDDIWGAAKNGDSGGKEDQNYSDVEIQRVEGGGKSTSFPLMLQPCLDLVRCLLRRAEFICMMLEARDDVLIKCGIDSINRFAHCSSRHQDMPINLHPLLLAAALETGRTDCSDDFVKILDECIGCAHLFSVDLASSLSDGWRFQFVGIPSAMGHPQLAIERNLEWVGKPPVVKTASQTVHNFVRWSLCPTMPGFSYFERQPSFGNRDRNFFDESLDSSQLKHQHSLPILQTEKLPYAGSYGNGRLPLEEFLKVVGVEALMGDTERGQSRWHCGYETTSAKSDGSPVEKSSRVSYTPGCAKVDVDFAHTCLACSHILGPSETSEELSVIGHGRDGISCDEGPTTVSNVDRRCRAAPLNATRASRCSRLGKQCGQNKNCRIPLVNLGGSLRCADAKRGRDGTRIRKTSQSSGSPDRKVGTRVGKRERWERKEFLRLVKVHGRGRWILMSKDIPTR